MFTFHLVILCFVLLPADESYGWVFCYKNDVLESLISCLVKRGINESLEVHGLQVDEFNRRLECARQAKCIPSLTGILDRKIRLVRQFFECMEEIPNRIGIVFGVYEGSAILYLHVFEWQCREKLADQLPHDLQVLYLPLLGKSDLK